MIFDDVAAITHWLDRSNEATGEESAMRVMKIGEEYGEAVQAYIGMRGQNPRKGVTHTLDQLLDELADVALTALCAIQHFTQNKTTTEEIFRAKVSYVRTRTSR